MNQNEQTQADLLLRRYARRNAQVVRGGQGSSAERSAAREAESSGGAHLDADELNAYAENALPNATRLRYMVHLVDCDACRRSVISLTLAAGIPNEPSQAAPGASVAPSRSWREWLGMIFAPPVMRYGVPALALCLVITAALIATRSQRDGANFVAKNEPAQTKVSTSADYNHSAPQTSNQNVESAPGVVSPSDTKTEAAKESAAGNAAPTSATTTTSAPGAPPTLSAAKPQPATTTAPTPANQTAPREVAADSPKSKAEDNAPPPAAAPQSERDSRDEALRGVRSGSSMPSQPPLARADKEEQNRSAENSPTEKKTADANNRSEPLSASVNKSAQTTDNRIAASGGAASGIGVREKAARRPAASRGRGAVSVDGASDTDNEFETHTAGGRRFRRQGNAWIDTAYNSSRATVNVARGSEQYRALVADEPAIGNIANQLGGEVVIVWKGRAYRIR
jgi:hypothetical protein